MPPRIRPPTFFTRARARGRYPSLCGNLLEARANLRGSESSTLNERTTAVSKHVRMRNNGDPELRGLEVGG